MGALGVDGAGLTVDGVVTRTVRDTAAFVDLTISSLRPHLDPGDVVVVEAPTYLGAIEERRGRAREAIAFTMGRTLLTCPRMRPLGSTSGFPRASDLR